MFSLRVRNEPQFDCKEKYYSLTKALAALNKQSHVQTSITNGNKMTENSHYGWPISFCT